jgi:hypothetical protein
MLDGFIRCSVLTSFLNSTQAIAVFIVGLLTVGVAWIRDFGTSVKRGRALEETSKRHQFWVAWICDIRNRRLPTPEENALAEREIRRCSSLMSDLYLHWPRPDEWTASAYRAYLAQTNWPKKLLLLISLPTRRLNLLRVLLITQTVLVLVLAGSAVKRETEFRANPAMAAQVIPAHKVLWIRVPSRTMREALEVRKSGAKSQLKYLVFIYASLQVTVWLGTSKSVMAILEGLRQSALKHSGAS